MSRYINFLFYLFIVERLVVEQNSFTQKKHEEEKRRN